MSNRAGTTVPEYIRPLVRLEMGARGEHWPSVNAEVRPYAAEEFPDVFKEPVCAVKVAAAERTFWEKATILHMWFHAPPEKTIGERQSRHYYDVAQLYDRGIGKNALGDLELLNLVRASDIPPTKDQLKVYGLAKPEFTIKVEADQPLEISFAEETTLRGTYYVKVEGRDLVYMARTSIRDRLARKPDRPLPPLES